jgi:predicted small lipoprotein YifL
MVGAMGETAVTRPRYLRVSVIAALAGACLLTGCGRKGPLDLPPGAAALRQQSDGTVVEGDPASPDFDQQGRPVAPTGPKRRTPMDWLID